MILPNTKTPSSILIAGCGDIGLRVAKHWLAKGATVSAISHSPQRRKSLTDQGITVCEHDLDQPLVAATLPTPPASLVYYFAPPPPHGETDPRIAHLLTALSERTPPDTVVYISTSGVYGNHNGGWVTEQTPPTPQTARARRRLAAEQTLQHWATTSQAKAIILRVGGIYGPGRLPLARLRQATPILHEAEAPFSNRIHADDLAAVCVAASEHPRACGIYNVCDGHPSTMSDYFLTVARLAGLPQPPQISWDEAQQALSPEMLSYLRESRRLDITRMRNELGVTLNYPTLEQGLAAALNEEGLP